MRRHDAGTRVRLRRGQAMVEYSLLTWILVAALLLLGSVPLFHSPAPGGGANRSLLELMVEAYQRYHDSFFFLLGLPFP